MKVVLTPCPSHPDMQHAAAPQTTPPSSTSNNSCIWGPPGWDFMHAATFAYPEMAPSNADKESMHRFLTTVGEVLPCGTCRPHWKEMMNCHPPDLRDRAALTKWLVDRHNDVNKRLGKPCVDYEIVHKKYTTDMTGSCPREPDSVQNRRRTDENPNGGDAKDDARRSPSPVDPLQAVGWSLVAVLGALLVVLLIYGAIIAVASRGSA